MNRVEELRNTAIAIKNVPATEGGLEELRNLMVHAVHLVADEMEERSRPAVSVPEAGTEVKAPAPNTKSSPEEGQNKEREKAATA